MTSQNALNTDMALYFQNFPGVGRQTKSATVRFFPGSAPGKSYQPGSWVFDVEFKADDEERLKFNVQPGETSALEQYVRKKSYRHSPNLNAMYNTKKRMQEIMEAPQLSSWEKSKLYSHQINRPLMFKNKMNRKSTETLVQRAPSVLSNVSEPPSPVSSEAAEIDAPPVPATPKPHFLTPPATEE